MWKLTQWYRLTARLLLKKGVHFVLVTLTIIMPAIANPFSQLVDSPQLNGNKSRQLFSIAGSSTVGEVLAPNLAKRFLTMKGAENVTIVAGKDGHSVEVMGKLSKQQREVSIAIEFRGSSTGFKALVAGKADIAAASRPIKNKELKQLAMMGDFRSAKAEHIIAIDGIAIIVNRNNPVQRLTVDQVAKIFSGKINGWSQINNQLLSIDVYSRDYHSGTWDTFKGLVLGKQRQVREAIPKFSSSYELSAAVAQSLGGIGFVSVNAVGNSKPIAIADGQAKAIMPNAFNVATEDYPLARRLYLYISPQSGNPWAGEFIRFTQSKSGQLVVKEHGYVPQLIAPIALSEENKQLPDNFKQLTNGYQRLTVNFRFYQGTAKLDNKAVKDVQRLATFINDQESKGHLLLVGFAEPHEREGLAKIMAKLRAHKVKRALQQAGLSRQLVSINGFGPYMEVSGQSSSATKYKNRRVEVWYQP